MANKCLSEYDIENFVDHGVAFRCKYARVVLDLREYYREILVLTLVLLLWALLGLLWGTRI